MDGGGVDLIDQTGEVAASDGSRLGPATDKPEQGEGQGATPLLALDNFDGPLERLLMLARAQQVDLTRLSLPVLLEQLEVALRQAPARMPLGQKADWLVMAAWLLQLRSRRLLPADAQAQQDAAVAADQLRGRLVEWQAMQGLAAWLERRPQLGRDVFARGKPEVFGVSVEPTPDLDVIEFLWASLALFDDGEPAPDTRAVYRPPPLALYPVGEARARILHRLAEAPGEVAFEKLLPDAPERTEGEALPVLQLRSAWSSTFVASLELAKQGDVVVAQEGAFQPIHLARVCWPAPNNGGEPSPASPWNILWDMQK
jgi:segregation and condensation protein A